MNHKELERWYRLRNIKRAAQVLVLVSVVLLVCGYLVSRFFAPTPEQLTTTAGPNTGSRIENFSYSSPGERPWELSAAAADVSDALDKVVLTRPRVVYHGGHGGKIVLTSDSGNLDKKSQSVFVRGNVQIRSEDMLFITDEIEYSHDSLIAQTASKVCLESKDLHLVGRGLKVSIDTEEIVIEEDVKASLRNVKWVERNGKLPM